MVKETKLYDTLGVCIPFALLPIPRLRSWRNNNNNNSYK